MIGFEEPENGIHPRRVQLIAEYIRNAATSGHTQIIVTTHSPLLANLIPNESLYVCRKKERRTFIEPFQPWGDLGKSSEVDHRLEEPLSVGDRIVRGDFDA